MPSLRASIRNAITIAAAAAVFPVVGEFFVELAKENGAYDQPTQRVGVVLSFLSSIADLPGFKIAAVFTIGLACGVWIDALLKRRERQPESAVLRIDRNKLADEAEEMAKKVGALAGEASARGTIAWAHDTNEMIRSNGASGLKRDAATTEDARILEKYGEKYHADVWRIVALATKCIPLDRSSVWRLSNSARNVHEIPEISQFLSYLAVNLRYPNLPDIPHVERRP